MKYLYLSFKYLQISVKMHDDESQALGLQCTLVIITKMKIYYHD